MTGIQPDLTARQLAGPISIPRCWLWSVRVAAMVWGPSLRQVRSTDLQPLVLVSFSRSLPM